MKRTSYSFLILFVVIFVLISLPKEPVQKFRGTAIAFLAPTWEQLVNFSLFSKKMLASIPLNSSPSNSPEESEEWQRLQLENQLLNAEIQHMRSLYVQERFLNYQLQNGKDSQNPNFKDFYNSLESQLQSVPARIIFRSADTWNSSLWINVGEANNLSLNQKIIARNSPVLVGNSVIGVIDYVGPHQSRVKLITDSGLHLSVRALRSQFIHPSLHSSLVFLLDYISENPSLNNLSKEEQHVLTKTIQQLKQHDQQQQEAWHLAKGELYGSTPPFGRSQGASLRGVGFNYDFDDEKGPARDLRNGKPISSHYNLPPMPIIKVNDLLVTTGLDGIFPPGLSVAIVTKISPLKEGDFYYELEAVPTAGPLDNLSLVFVIPSQEYDNE